ncbi:MAG: alanine--glyoxylate aminotransferase family protein [Planctomycetota bacterium]|nr:MAG: alanine--glyoxylate aminotransferase family protein [Planctomycetota bacterium]
MLWIPGPTEVRPEILAECARGMIGHRSKAMVATIERIDPGLRLAFGLRADSTAHVAVHSTSATAMMESALVGAGRRVLSIVNGAFSQRWCQIAALLGQDAVALDVGWGAVVDPTELERVLTEEGPFDAVTLVSSETSTGTFTPLGSVGAVLARFPETLLLVDLVSCIAGAPVDFDANGIDFGLAGVQKALALPPGIAVVCASDRYLERARAKPGRGYTLDPVLFIEGHEARKTPATPAISLYFALAKQLEDITGGVTLPEHERQKTGREAWTARFEKHARMRAATIAWAKGHGLALLPEEQYGSPTVSCIRAGDVDVAALVTGLAERGLSISDGYGPLKGETFRIGHMGDHTEEGLAELLAATDEVLAAIAR